MSIEDKTTHIGSTALCPACGETVSVSWDAEGIVKNVACTHCYAIWEVKEAASGEVTLHVLPRESALFHAPHDVKLRTSFVLFRGLLDHVPLRRLEETLRDVERYNYFLAPEDQMVASPESSALALAFARRFEAARKGRAQDVDRT